MMKIQIVGILSVVGLSSCVIVNVNPPVAAATPAAQTPIVRGALSGQRQVLVSFYTLGSDCSSLGYPTLKVTHAPKHGAVSVEHGSALATVSGGDARNVCNGQTVPATVIYYTPAAGFVGEDSAAFERIGVRGEYGYHAYTIEVR